MPPRISSAPFQRLFSSVKRPSTSRTKLKERIVSCPVNGLYTKRSPLTIKDRLKRSLATGLAPTEEITAELTRAARLRKDLFLYGEKFVEKSKRLVLCPVNGFIKPPRETLFRGFVARFHVLDREAPLFMKIAFSGCCALTAEMIVQKFTDTDTKRREKLYSDSLTQAEIQQSIDHNLNRLWAMPLVNMIYVGTGVNFWVSLMEKSFPGTTPYAVGAKIFSSMIGLNLLYTGYMIGGTQIFLDQNREKKELLKDGSLMKGDRWQETKTLFLASTFSGPLIYLVQFSLIPATRQVHYLAAVNLAFAVFACKTMK